MKLFIEKNPFQKLLFRCAQMAAEGLLNQTIDKFPQVLEMVVSSLKSPNP